MKKVFLFASVTMMVAMALSCDNKTNKNDKTVEVTDSTVVSLASETTTEESDSSCCGSTFCVLFMQAVNIKTIRAMYICLFVINWKLFVEQTIGIV